MRPIYSGFAHAGIGSSGVGHSSVRLVQIDNECSSIGPGALSLIGWYFHIKGWSGKITH